VKLKVESLKEDVFHVVTKLAVDSLNVDVLLGGVE